MGWRRVWALKRGVYGVKRDVETGDVVADADEDPCYQQ